MNSDVTTDTPTGGGILDGYQSQDDFARDHHITGRTVGRYRRKGLPWIAWGGRVLIPLDAARDWLRGQIKYPKAPTKRRR
jgi:hypothetical protein